MREGRNSKSEGAFPEEKSTLHRVARGLDKTVNIVALVLLVLLLLYAGHSLWYTHSLQEESFLPDELAKYRPDGQKPSLEDLAKINPDVNAWITIDDTHIDYPVVQGKDDNEYLNKSVLGEFSLAGSLFLAKANRPDYSDPYNMIYGHHIDGGAMLADVIEFLDASFFKTHTQGTLWYPDKDGKARADRIEIFAAIRIDGRDEVVYQDPSTVTPEKLREVTEFIRANSTNSRAVDIDGNSRVIGLSTCEDAVSFGRVLIFGKLRPMTDEEIRAAQAKEREGAASQNDRKGLSRIFGALPPWVLLSGGTLLIILLIYLLWRMHRRRQEEKRYRENKYRL